MLRPLGHVGLFSGLYVAAAFVSLAQLAGVVIVPPPLALLSITLLSTAAYALDRVKLRDRWIDPSDPTSQPDRYAFLQPRARTVRALAFLMLLVGGLLGLTYTDWAPLAALLIPLGVLLGMPLPGGMRLLAARRAELIPWGWGMNGAFSVVGATLAVFIAMNWGFSATLLIGALVYAGAAATLRTR